LAGEAAVAAAENAGNGLAGSAATGVVAADEAVEDAGGTGNAFPAEDVGEGRLELPVEVAAAGNVSPGVDLIKRFRP
jgi:hypothetical protein